MLVSPVACDVQNFERQERVARAAVDHLARDAASDSSPVSGWVRKLVRAGRLNLGHPWLPEILLRTDRTATDSAT